MPNSDKLLTWAYFWGFTFTLAVVVVLPTRAIAWNERPCSGSPITKLQGTNDRRAVEGDYVVIEYNEASRRAFWYDYRDHFREHPFVDRNHRFVPEYGSFLPVVDTKEKIAVHVCGLHFGDQLTVTTNPLVAPEGGADIRGVTSSSQTPNLTASLDAIQNPSITGSAITGGNLGYSTTPGLISPVVTGVTPGKFSTRGADGTATYTDGAITASGTQVALMMYATYMNAQSLIASVKQFELPSASKMDTYSRGKVAGDDRAINKNLSIAIDPAPGSIEGIQREMHLLGDIELAKQHLSKDDATAFDEDVNSTQILAGDITALSNAIAAQGFGARAVAIQNNYAALKGILDLSGYKDIGTPIESDAASPGCAAQPEKTSTTTQTTAEQTVTVKTSTSGTTKTTTTTTVTTPNLLAGLTIDPKTAKLEPIPAATATCDIGEQTAFENFKRAYVAELNKLAQQTHGNLLPPDTTLDASAIDNFQPASTFEEIANLGADLKTIDDKAADIFNTMNEWYRDSKLEQTDLIAPATANYLMRVSIIVQRGYTPFTLASAPTPTGVAVTVAAAAPVTATTSTSTAVTTGTPAHAVETVLVEVHRVANFNLAGGPVVLHVPTKSYSVVPGTVPPTASPTMGTGYLGTCGGVPTLIPGTGSATSAPAYSCVVQTQTTPWQVAAMVGVVWYPWRHDYFPRHSGFSNFRQNYYPSLLIATSVNTLGNALGAVNFEPITGVDLFAGVGSANSTRLPPGESLTTSVPSTYTFTGVTNVHTGISAGIALDLGIFTQLFTKSQVAAMP